MKAAAVLLLIVALLAAPIAAQSAICSECQKVVAWLENELSSNSTLGELESALETVCSLMPPAEQGTCQNLVTKYLPDAIQWILSRASPQDACSAVGLCTSLVAPPPPSPAPNPSDLCKICELAAAGAELYIDSHPNDTAAEVIHAMMEVCNFSFLAKYKFECELLINSEGSAIVNALFSGKPASQVCSSTVPPICPADSAVSDMRAHHGKGMARAKGMGMARGMAKAMRMMHRA